MTIRSTIRLLISAAMRQARWRRLVMAAACGAAITMAVAASAAAIPAHVRDAACRADGPAAGGAVAAVQGMWLFDTSGFPPRWQTGTWSASLGWLHIVSDVAIWGAYMAIPIVLGFFLYRKRTPLPLVTWLFIAFIGACGIGHFIEAIIFWEPVYRLAGVWKALTAAVSWLTVAALVPIAPKVLRWPSITELSDRLRAESEEREHAEVQGQQLMDGAPAGMLMIDDQGVIVLANRQVEETFGYDRHELLGTKVEMLVPEHFRRDHTDHRAAFLAQPSARRMGGDRELFGLHKQGHEIPIDIGLSPVRTPRGLRVLASVVDVTVRRRLDAQLRDLNESLEQKNAELEQFVYTASHDLKAPMVTIQGFAGFMIKELREGRMDRLEHYASRIVEATRRMHANIDDLLELSRIGRVRRDVEEVEVGALAAGLRDDMAAQIAETGALLTIEEDIPMVRAERVRVAQVLQNLVNNALKYAARPDRNLEIRIGGRRVGSHVHLFVSDNGPGIATEFHEKVFGLFQRLQVAGEGSGVGLAIVRRVAETHGGRAWVESTPDEGATFYVSFPRAEGDAADLAA